MLCILSRGGDGVRGMLAGPKVLLLSCYHCEPGSGRGSHVHTAHASSHSILRLFISTSFFTLPLRVGTLTGFPHLDFPGKRGHDKCLLVGH